MKEPLADQSTTTLPDRISRCWQNGGYHALGAGPCFDTVEQAVAYRDKELRRIGAWCDARASKRAFYDFEAEKWVTWGEHYDEVGWPDGREVAA